MKSIFTLLIVLVLSVTAQSQSGGQICSQSLQDCSAAFNRDMEVCQTVTCATITDPNAKQACLVTCSNSANQAYSRCIAATNAANQCNFPQSMDCTPPVSGCSASSRNLRGSCIYSCASEPADTTSICVTNCQAACMSEGNQCRGDALATYPIYFSNGVCLGSQEGCAAYNMCTSPNICLGLGYCGAVCGIAKKQGRERGCELARTGRDNPQIVDIGIW